MRRKDKGRGKGCREGQWGEGEGREGRKKEH